MMRATEATSPSMDNMRLAGKHRYTQGIARITDEPRAEIQPRGSACLGSGNAEILPCHEKASCAKRSHAQAPHSIYKASRQKSTPPSLPKPKQASMSTLFRGNRPYPAKRRVDVDKMLISSSRLASTRIPPHSIRNNFPRSTANYGMINDYQIVISPASLLPWPAASAACSTTCRHGRASWPHKHHDAETKPTSAHLLAIGLANPTMLAR